MYIGGYLSIFIILGVNIKCKNMDNPKLITSTVHVNKNNIFNRKFFQKN